MDLSDVIVTGYAKSATVATVTLILLVLLLWVLWLIEAIKGIYNSLQLYNELFVREYYCLFEHLLSFLIALTGLIVLAFITILFVGLNYFGYTSGKS